MSTRLSRRDFLKLGGLGAAGGALALAEYQLRRKGIIQPPSAEQLPTAQLPTPMQILPIVKEERQSTSTALAAGALLFAPKLGWKAKVGALSLLATSCAQRTELPPGVTVTEAQKTEVATQEAAATGTPPPTHSPEELIAPVQGSQEIPSVIEGLNLGQISPQETAGIVPGYLTPINTLYSPEAPLVAAAFGIDQKFLLEYFKAKPNEAGEVVGTTKTNNGEVPVKLQNGIWSTGTGEVFIPFIKATAGTDAIYQVIDVNGQIQQTDKDGKLIGSPRPMFETAQTVATEHNFPNADKVIGVEMNKGGSLSFISQEPRPTEKQPNRSVKTVKQAEFLGPIEDLSTNPLASKTVGEFTGALAKAGVTVAAGELLSKNMTVIRVEGIDPADATHTKKKNFDVATVTVEGEKAVGDCPVMVKTENEGWTEMTPAKLYSLNDWVLETAVTTYQHETNGDWTFLLGKQEYADLLRGSCTRMLNTGEMETDWVFGNFQKGDWDKVLTDWDGIKAKLDNKEVPQGFAYNWNGAEDFVKFAKENHLPIRASLISDGNVPSDFASYSPEDARKLLEFIVKTRVIKFSGDVESWNLPNEMVERTNYGNQGYWSGKKLTAVESTKLTAQFIKEVNKDARLVLVNDFVLENFPSADFDVNYFAFVDALLQEKVPIDALTFENNLWVYDPIHIDKVKKVFEEAKKRGLKIEGGETTIAVSPTYPNWPSRPQTTNLNGENPLWVQSEMYAELADLYLANGITSFGFGNLDDEHSWQGRTGYPESNPGISANGKGEKKAAWYTFMAAAFKYAA